MTEHPQESWLAAPIDRAPQRVVSLVPSVTESLFELNLGARVVGITDYCIYPADAVAALPKIGGTKNPDVARILALAPDLVIANREENRKEDVEALQAAGVPVWVTFPKTVEDTINLLWAMMDLFDETSMVPRVRLIDYTYDWVRGIVQQREDRGESLLRVFVPIWFDPLMTFNADTFSHNLLRACGALNVFAERERRYPLAADLGQAEAYAPDDPRVQGRDTRYPRVTVEEVVAAQPDIILLPSEPYTFSEKDLPFFQALDVPAARNQQIHLIDGSLLTWPGTRIARAFEVLPALFNPAE